MLTNKVSLAYTDLRLDSIAHTFWSQGSKEIFSKSRQQSPWYAMEGYIHSNTFTSQSINAKCYRLMRKREKLNRGDN